MIVDAMTVIRRRDHLGTLCPNCCEGKLRTYYRELVYCTVCSFTCNRWLTKAELLDILEPEEEFEEEIIDDRE